MPDLQRIDFHGQEIVSWHDERTGIEYASPREMCERIGMDWATQYRKLTTSLFYRRHIVRCHLDNGAGLREYIGLDRRYIAQWLGSISLERVKGASRDLLLTYQEECADALDAYWTKGLAVNPRLPTSNGDLLVQMAEAYRAQEQRLVAIEAAQRESQQQRLEDQTALIVSQQQAIDALQLATGANTKSDLALEDAHRMTLEEFVLKTGLVRQFPPSQYATYTTWLRTFCRSYGLMIHKAPVYGKSWDEENSYPLAALAAWLRYETKKPQQVHLVQ